MIAYEEIYILYHSTAFVLTELFYVQPSPERQHVVQSKSSNKPIWNLQCQSTSQAQTKDHLKW